MKTKVLTITMICFLVVGIQSVFAQDIVPFEKSSGYSAPPPPASQAPQSDKQIFGPMRDGGWGELDPEENDTTGGKAPITGGYLLLTSLAVVYGIVRRKQRKER